MLKVPFCNDSGCYPNILDYSLAMAALGYLAELKSGLGLAFGAHFQHGFLWKCSLLNSLLMDKVSVLHLSSFSRYQPKCVI